MIICHLERVAHPEQQVRTSIAGFEGPFGLSRGTLRWLDTRRNL